MSELTKYHELSAKEKIGWLIAILAPLCIILMPTTELFTLQVKEFVALTLWAIIMWAMDLLPKVVTAVMLCVFYILLGLAPASAVFGGPFSMAVPWLLLGGMIISKVFEQTPLLKRFSYWLIIKLGGSYRAMLYGLALSGVVISLLIPNSGARVVLYATLTIGICNAVGAEKETKLATAIMLAGLVASSNISPMFQTGKDTIILAEGFFEEAGLFMSWWEYFKMNGALFFAWGLVNVIIVEVLFRPEKKIGSKKFFQEELAEMGKMEKGEIKMGIILLLVGVLLITQIVEAQWSFLLCACICFLPGINLANEKMLKNINWSMIIFTACTIAIGNVAASVGADAWISDICMGLLSGRGTVATYSLVWVVAVILNLFMTPLSAASAFIPALIDLTQQLGLNTFSITYMFLQGLQQIFFPFEISTMLLFYSFGYVSYKNITKYFITRMACNFVYMICICLPIWGLMGYVA